MSEPGESIVEIRDPEVDVDAIMAELRHRLDARRAELGDEEPTYPPFGLAPLPDPPAGLPHDAALYQELRILNATFNNAETAPNLAQSPATQVPVAGKVWGVLRRQVHELILFYVNRQLAHQVTVNRSLVSVLNRLTAELAEQRRDLEALRAEIEQRPPPR